MIVAFQKAYYWLSCNKSCGCKRSQLEYPCVHKPIDSASAAAVNSHGLLAYGTERMTKEDEIDEW